MSQCIFALKLNWFHFVFIHLFIYGGHPLIFQWSTVAPKDCYKIIWIVCVLWLVNKCVFIVLLYKHANDVSNMVISKLWGFTVSWKKFKYCILCIVYTVFLFVKIENSNFIKEIKHVLRAFVAWWKSCENSLTGKNSTASQVFTLKFSWMLAFVFTRLWRHGENVLFLKWSAELLLHIS